MENKNNNILIIILTILVVGLLGYTIYGKVVENKESEVISSNTSETNNTGNTDVVTTEKSADERYKTYLNNLKSNIQNKLNGEHVEQIITLNVDINLSFAIDKDLNLTSNGEKIDTNVLEMFISNSGNGGYRNLYYIKDDGKVYSIRITPDAKIEEMDEKRENKCKNIIAISNVANMVTNSTIFTDIDGNVYTTSDCYNN